VIDADLVPGEQARLHAALAHTLANLLGSGELDWIVFQVLSAAGR
jgi:hypothetical protein